MDGVGCNRNTSANCQPDRPGTSPVAEKVPLCRPGRTLRCTCFLGGVHAQASEWIRLAGIPDRQPSQIRELLDGRLAAEAAIAGTLDAAERHVRLVMDGWPVDVADAGLEARRDGHRPLNVAAE